MKKYLSVILGAVIVGFLLSQFMINQYEKKEKLLTVFNRGEKVYLIQQGVYSSEESVLKNTMDFSYYITSIENNMYYVYIGVTKDLDNIKKLQGYFDKMGYITYSKEVFVTNKSFLEILEQYDNLLKTTTDNAIISAICNQTLSKYEELVVGDNKD
ncbi:MAG: hypothetical protein PHD10_02975 [Bacilli bacterium]|nr:hypothetical protein [Bacilli bacterium]MDD4608074.1 hypothetical protein [Bacilli bacterium]